MPEPAPIDRAFFREAEDGATVFFPWGLTRRGYRLPDPAARQRAARAASLLIGSTIGIGTWTAYRLQPLLESEAAGPAQALAACATPVAAMLLAIFFYYLWVSRFVEDLPESDLRVSREETLREAAELGEPRKVALIGVVLCGLSALVIWIDPHVWWIGALGIALGVGLTLWSARLLRAAGPPA